MKPKKLLVWLSLIVLLFAGCTTTHDVAPIRDADGSYTSTVLDTSNDSGKLTARYLNTTGSLETGNDVTYAGDCIVFTSPDGFVMMIDCSNTWSFDEIDAQLKV